MRLHTLTPVTAILVLALSAVAWSASAQPAQKTFTNPQEAADALIAAVDRFDVPALLEIFGPEGKDLVSSPDGVQDKNKAAASAAKAREKHEVAIDPKSPSRATLIVGPDDWPFPVPLVKKSGKWF